MDSANWAEWKQNTMLFALAGCGWLAFGGQNRQPMVKDKVVWSRPAE